MLISSIVIPMKLCNRTEPSSLTLQTALFFFLRQSISQSTMFSFKQITGLKSKCCISAAIFKTLVRVFSSNLHSHLLTPSPPATSQKTSLSQSSKYNSLHIGYCYQSSLSEKDEPTHVDGLFDKLLNEIEHHSPACTRQICADYFGKLIRQKNLEAAYKLLQILRTRNIFLDIIPLLEAAGEENDVQLISQLFKDAAVSSSNGALQLIPYHSFAKALRNGNDPSLLLGFVKQVSESFSFRVLALNRIILAFAEIGQIDKALLIFVHMKSMILKCRPDLFTYDIVIEILGKVGRVVEMVEVFGSMNEANLVPDIYTYNALLNSSRKVGRLDMCVVFVKEMEEKGIEPDLCTYTALIEIFGRSGNVEKSLQLFETMKDKGVRPSIYIYRSLINSLKKTGKLDRAVKLQEEMRRSASDLVTPKDFKRKRR